MSPTIDLTALIGAFITALSGAGFSTTSCFAAILALCLVGVGGTTTLGVFGFGAAFGLDSGLLAGVRGFALLPGLRPLERLRGFLGALTICFLTSFALIVNTVPSSYCKIVTRH